MKTDKFFKDLPFHRNGNYQGLSQVLHVRVSCDVCTNAFQYEGAESQAREKTIAEGWSHGVTGIVRCKECTKRKDFILSHSLEARP
jgi:hypothetical protein